MTIELKATKNLAIIPARGGSKRIPRKNIKDFLGKPIISYTISMALESGLFESVMVSTDDEEIAAIARKSGADVPFLRSGKNSDDFATTTDVLLEVLDNYKASGKLFECACCLYPASPLIRMDTFTSAYKLLLDNEFDTVLPVIHFSHPIWRSFKTNETNKGIQLNWPEHVFTRTQDLPKAFFDAGLFYWFRTDALRKKQSLLTDNMGAVFIDEMDAQDIDNESDWQLAEFKYMYRNRRKNDDEKAS